MNVRPDPNLVLIVAGVTGIVTSVTMIGPLLVDISRDLGVSLGQAGLLAAAAGVPQALFDGFAAAAQADTPAWMKGFLDNFYNFDTLRGTLVSDQAWQASWNLAVTASATAAGACIGTWTTDFRDDPPPRPC